MGGVVVRRDHDGAVPLDHERSGRPVHGNDVLASGARADCQGGLPSERPQQSQHGRHGGEEEADEGENPHAKARDERAEEHRDGDDRGDQSRNGGDVKLLDGGLDVMLAHEARNGLGCLKLLLTVRRSDADPLVEVIQVVVSHSHTGRPFEESRKTCSSGCIQSRQYTSYAFLSLKRRRCTGRRAGPLGRRKRDAGCAA